MQTITVDMTPNEKAGPIRPTLQFSQGDIGREFAINLYSRHGVTIPSGAVVKIEATKPSGLGFSVTGTVTDGVFYSASTLDMTDEYGRFSAGLTISNSGTVLGSANFNIFIEKDPHPDGTTDGRSDEVIPALTQLVERAETAANSVHTLTVQATTLNPNTPATATYDAEDNEITFGVPRGAMLTATDDGNGIITLTFS